ncbi:energy coupling factor transporter S component ThiW [Aeropyrum camini]|uniref:Predicted membrane protein n=1 Tax=Aeropyrum camini SY1 = JCM 12091 TaxID=1198449 RepID=U3TEU9_9CREN|nr:energy coupling factor transporter S component ThiW [Aeropyrum camini]BAN90976.1 predicted membrane protein [Aeropyrum camini SY1 = JCM 12091]
MSLSHLGPERKLALAAILGGLAVSLSVIRIDVGPTKALPWQHMVNVVAGVILGPWWASGLALAVGLVRMALGIGTIYSIPGGIPGALLVGLGAVALLRLGRNPIPAGLLEPLGTAVVGFLLALYIFAPLMGDVEAWRSALTVIWLGWLASTLIGTTLGVAALVALERSGVVRLRPPDSGRAGEG